MVTFLLLAITTQEYVFVSANHFCLTTTTKTFIPAELALVKYSVSLGCGNKYHTFINPRKQQFSHRLTMRS